MATGKPAAHCAGRSDVDCPVDLAEIRFHRAVVRLHTLGPRAVAELLAEIGARFLIRHPIEATVDRYVAALDDRRTLVVAVGADRMPAVPSPRLAPAQHFVVAICARI